jgi:hypothetical protein
MNTENYNVYSENLDNFPFPPRKPSPTSFHPMKADICENNKIIFFARFLLIILLRRWARRNNEKI